MLRPLIKPLFLAALVIGGSLLLWQWETRWSESARREQEVRRLKEEKQKLEEFITRLTAQTRVGEIVVTDQVKKGDQVESTTLLFAEYSRDGKQLAPRFFTIKGNVVHIDSLVIKFDNRFVEEGDGLRGHSLVLFYRLYGDYQAPIDGFRIDEPGKVPEIYRNNSTSAAAADFEAELWKNFWKLADDKKYANEKGVRVAQGEGPWTHLSADKV